MDNQQLPSDGVKEFKFKMDKAEKMLSFGILILFFLSFTNQKSVLLNILFFGVSGLIFIYYFVWYRKKPPYVIIRDNEVIINHMPFFKSQIIKKEKISKAQSIENKIIVKYDDKGITKETSLFKLFLDLNDQKNIVSILK